MQEFAARRTEGAAWRFATLATIGFALANALCTAWVADWTYDEPFHLEWSEVLLTQRIADRHSQHFNAKTPVMLPNVLVRMAVRRFSEAEPALRFASRLPSVAWLAALFATLFCLGRWQFGTVAAHLATAAAALDPNLVAHGSLATVDVAYALATLLTVAAALRFAEAPTPWRAAGLGLALGLALTAKFSAVLLLPALLLLPVLQPPRSREWPRWVVGALIAGVVTAATLCATYLFVDVGASLGAHRWGSRPLIRLAQWWPALRLPLPSGFLTGLDASLAAERGEWNVVILSRFYPRGIWFYFAVLWLLKTPLLVLFAELSGFWRVVRTGSLWASSATRLLLVMLIVHLGYFSLLFRTQVGYRFVLMCVPLAYLLAAAGLVPLTSRRWAAAAGAGILAVATIENVMYFGDPIAFTNLSVWPKRQAFRLMADSNLDWGQDDAKVLDWLEHHPGSRGRFNPPHILPGRNVFDVDEVAGVSDFARHRFLREHADPVGGFRHTLLFFDVDEDLFSRFLDAERTLGSTSEEEAACPAGLAYARLPAGADTPFFVPGHPGDPERWIVCVSARQGADLGLRSLRGRIHLGRYETGAPCEGEVASDSQELWHRLGPGTHALCAEVVEEDGTSPAFEGRWRVARSELSLSIRERADHLVEPEAPVGRKATRRGR